MEEYNITALATTETKISAQNNITQTLKTSNGKVSYVHYLSGSKNTKQGVGIVVKADTKCSFMPINDRICKLTIYKKRNNIVIISAYAPTLAVSKKHPEQCELFYENLESLIHTVNERDLLVIAGDFNAKTGSAYKDFKNEMGRFGKGEVNENGTELLEFCARNSLTLTNTTWQAPETPNRNHANEELRRHPVRNQIDYIIVRRRDLRSIHDSRSYSGMQTRSDHRLILATVKDAIPTQKRKYNATIKPDYDKLRIPDFSDLYKQTLQEKIENTFKTNHNIQEQWDSLVELNHKTSIEVLGKMNNTKKSANPEIIKLSREQKNINAKINASKNNHQCTILRKERNQKLTKIHNLLKMEEAEKIMKDVEKIVKKQLKKDV